MPSDLPPFDAEATDPTEHTTAMAYCHRFDPYIAAGGDFTNVCNRCGGDISQPFDDDPEDTE